MNLQYLSSDACPQTPQNCGLKFSTKECLIPAQSCGLPHFWNSAFAIICLSTHLLLPLHKPGLMQTRVTIWLQLSCLSVFLRKSGILTALLEDALFKLWRYVSFCVPLSLFSSQKCPREIIYPVWGRTSTRSSFLYEEGHLPFAYCINPIREIWRHQSLSDVVIASAELFG